MLLWQNVGLNVLICIYVVSLLHPHPCPPDFSTAYATQYALALLSLVFIGVVGTFFAMIAYPDPVFLTTMLLPLTLRAIALNDIKSVPDWIGDLERNGLRILTWFMDGLVGILAIIAFVLLLMRVAENGCVRRRRSDVRADLMEPLNHVV
eukprot:GHVO01049791.1.p1 GENE.GHVO01049791.1~~GHVO01049791.1.p1  ORF type:complete len:150 (-),score=7.33 GHVO01049791.1:81-530(-)